MGYREISGRVCLHKFIPYRSENDRVDKLAERFVVSQRTMERQFRVQVGVCKWVSPSEFAKLVRVKQVRLALKRLDLPFNDIVHKLGYYDQAYLIDSLNPWWE